MHSRTRSTEADAKNSGLRQLWQAASGGRAERGMSAEEAVAAGAVPGEAGPDGGNDGGSAAGPPAQDATRNGTSEVVATASVLHRLALVMFSLPSDKRS